ncbi:MULTISPECIES: MFS transporter [unclassified Pantoea]|uniref:MFS transporter n=1 Tax=unclassified Pantoea TaxID=2630326 RepID=UPI00301D5C27
MQKAFRNSSIFKIILIQDFIGAFAFFAPQALLIAYLHENMQLSSEDTSGILFTLIFFSRIGRLAFSPYLNKINFPLLLTILQLLGGLGFYLLSRGGIIDLYLGAFLIGLFYGNNSIVIRIATSFLKNQSLTLNYSLLSTVTNLASSGGAIFLGLLYKHLGPVYMFEVMSAFFSLTCAYTFWATRKITLPQQGHFFKLLLSLVRKKVVSWTLLIIVLVWFIYSLALTTMPLFVIDRLHRSDLVWTVTALNGLAVLILAYPVNRLIVKLSDNTKLIISFLLFGSAFLLLSLRNSMGMLYLFLLLISAAEIIAIPAYQSIMSSNTEASERTAIFSLSIISVGIGESLGAVFAVWTNEHNSLFHIIFVFVFVATILISLFCRRNTTSLA